MFVALWIAALIASVYTTMIGFFYARWLREGTWIGASLYWSIAFFADVMWLQSDPAIFAPNLSQFFTIVAATIVCMAAVLFTLAIDRKWSHMLIVTLAARAIRWFFVAGALLFSLHTLAVAFVWVEPLARNAAIWLYAHDPISPSLRWQIYSRFWQQ